MSERSASRTAMSVAAMRAFHQLYDGEPKILDDPIAARIVDDGSILRVGATRNPWTEALRLHVLVRSRYAEDRLAEAASRGVAQFVSLGAGYDTFAYRQPEWAHRLRVYEVDHPASQAAKRERLASAGVPLPENLTFVPIDFERTSLSEGMRAGGFDTTQPAFFSWLGVMMYLDLAAIDTVFAYVASLPSPSEIAFSYARPGRLFAAEAPIAAAAAAVGEPWKSRFSAKELEARLRAHGFADVDFLDARTANARYHPIRAGLPPMMRVSIGAARLSAPAAPA
jgi:methyltransferase (TIGR00027 family)